MQTKLNRKEIERTIAASLVYWFDFCGCTESFKKEISDLKSENFSVPLFREIFESFFDGTLKQCLIDVATYKEFEQAWTHVGNIRWYCLRLLEACEEKTT